MTRVRTTATVGASLVLGLTLSGCGGNSSSSSQTEDIKSSATPYPTSASNSSAPTSTPSPPASTNSPVTIPVTVTATTVTPDGTKIQVKRNQKVIFEITAEKPGELHAHSSPGQELAYPAGKSTGSMTFDQPGVVDVEDHGLDKLVVKLEVR